MGPVPFCGMLLADLGAEVLRIDRPGAHAAIPGPTADAVVDRGRCSLVLDLDDRRDKVLLLSVIEHVDVLVEGYRPGVVERLGVGPSDCLARNPSLVYGRICGFGRSGPWSDRAGHDIDFLAVSGILDAIGRWGSSPTPPLNLVGDNAGALLLAFGIVCALLERASSRRGQVVDTSMVGGAALLAAPFYALRAQGVWSAERGDNLLDSGAPFYNTYETADGRFLAVGAIEERFYRAFVTGLGLDPDELPAQMDRTAWPEVTGRVTAILRRRTLDEWLEVYAGVDACVAPVLRLDEVSRHPFHAARGTFVTSGGLPQPVPMPSFSRTPGALPPPGPNPGAGGMALLRSWGLAKLAAGPR